MAREPLKVLTESMFYVLLSLLRQERCGTEIVRYVDDATAGRVPLGPGTLYTILAKFQEEGLIREAAVEDGCLRVGKRLYRQVVVPPLAFLAQKTLDALRRLREGKSVYFSDDLCARYFTYRSGSENHYVLFDDAQTLRKKADMAENRGIREGFFMLPEVADITGELLG